MKEKKNKQKEKQLAAEIAGAESKISSHGRFFSGYITKKFSKRIVLEFERTVYVKKYERFFKKKIRIHARLPSSIEVNIGDLVKVQECRPLSKIIHHVVIEKLKSSNNSVNNIQATSHSNQGGSKR